MNFQCREYLQVEERNSSRTTNKATVALTPISAEVIVSEREIRRSAERGYDIKQQRSWSPNKIDL